MNTSENKSLLENAFAELAKGNAAPLVGSFADDVTWTAIGTTKFSKTYSGKASVLGDLLGPVGAGLDGPIAIDAHRFIAEGDFVVVEARGRAMAASGAPYNNTYCFVFRLEDGKVKEVTEYADTEPVTATFGR
jgi:ketosteroid isomerase-like protein